jgi:phage-related protein (TIGR01555 family)
MARDPNKKPTQLQKNKAFVKRFSGIIRGDEYQNEYTGVGSRTRDSLQFSRFFRPLKLSDEDLSNLYHGNDIFSRLAELVPSEALKLGFEIETGEYSQDSELEKKDKQASPEDLKALQNVFMKCDELQLTQKAQKAWIWGNVFGAGIMYIGINDGNPQDQPVDLNKIQSIDFIKVLDKRYVRQHSVYSNPEHPKYGEVSQYAIRPSPSAAVTNLSLQEAIIHESRIVFFEGAETADDRKRENAGWADSIFQRLEEPIKHLVTAFQSVAGMMQKSAQGKMKMSGYLDAVSANAPEYVDNRISDMLLRASNNRPFIFDAESNEDYQLESYSFNGIPQLQELFMLRVCSALRVPYSIFFGQSPSGLNATGQMEVRTFYDQVKHKQMYILKPILEYIVKLIMLSKKGPTKGKEIDQWSVCFPSLWQMNELEEAQVEKLEAEARKLNIEADKLDTGSILPTIPKANAENPPNPAADIIK